MRLVLLILLLLNVMYFGWQHYLPTGNNEDNIVASDPGLEKLVLLHEINQSTGKQVEGEGERLSSVPVIVPTPEPVPEPKTRQEPGSSQLTEKVPEQIPESVPEQPVDQAVDQMKVMEEPAEVEQSLPEEILACYEVGPYKTSNEARPVLELLEADVMKVELLVRPGKISKYWVFLPPQKTLKAATQTVNQLASKGIKDYQILTMAVKKNGISLGLFREKKIAELRVKNIKKLGYAPEISVINKEVTEHWLEVVTDQADKEQQEKLNVIPAGMVNKTPCAQ